MFHSCSICLFPCNQRTIIISSSFPIIIKDFLFISQRHGNPSLDASDPEILGHAMTWIRELPLLLIMLGDKHPSHSKVRIYLLPFLFGFAWCWWQWRKGKFKWQKLTYSRWKATTKCLGWSLLRLFKNVLQP